MTDLAVGSTVYVFDENRRVYTKPADGGWGEIIYREHFRPRKIVGETSRSWVLEGYDEAKVNKKTLAGVYVDDEAVDRACWIHDNAHKISYQVGNLTKQGDYDKLRAIAEIIGYGAAK